MRLSPLLKIYPFIVILLIMSVYTTADKYLLVEIEHETGVDPLPEANPTEELPTYEDEGPATATEPSPKAPAGRSGGSLEDVLQDGGVIRPGRRFQRGGGPIIRPGRRSGFR